MTNMANKSNDIVRINKVADSEKAGRKIWTKDDKKMVDYECHICKKHLNSLYGARLHIRITHNIENHIFCPHCEFAAG